MDKRRDHLAQWAAGIICQQSELKVNAQLEIVSGDASFRRYFRLRHNQSSWIAVDAPADKEDNPRFLRIARAWYDQGVAVPRVIGEDIEQGFMLLEDLGDQLLWPALHDSASQEQVKNLYSQAIDQLMHIQQLRPDSLPVYDETLLNQEMSLFTDWLCERQLAMNLSDAEREMLSAAFSLLREQALAQPQVVVHRDYHSRNLMIREDQSLAVIDFQDAVVGAASYDLVSLLRDCYVRWPAELVDELAAEYWQKARGKGIYLAQWKQFQRDFDWMGLQRHLKAAGIFARLSLRDGKTGYLADIPNTCQYLLDISGKYDEFRDFNQWLKTRFMPQLVESQLTTDACSPA